MKYILFEKTSSKGSIRLNNTDEIKVFLQTVVSLLLSLEYWNAFLFFCKQEELELVRYSLEPFVDSKFVHLQNNV